MGQNKNHFSLNFIYIYTYTEGKINKSHLHGGGHLQIFNIITQYFINIYTYTQGTIQNFIYNFIYITVNERHAKYHWRQTILVY